MIRSYHKNLRATEGPSPGPRWARCTPQIRPLDCADKVLRPAPEYDVETGYSAAPPFYEPRCQASPGVETNVPLGRFPVNLPPVSRRSHTATASRFPRGSGHPVHVDQLLS